MQMTSLIEILNAIYSASVMDNAIVVCSFDAHTIGHPANLIMYPVRDKTSRGFDVSVLSYPPAKSASTKHSIPFVESTLRFIP